MNHINEKIKDFIINLQPNTILNFKDIFGNNNPITLEIGSGKGEFIATISRFHPERNFLGIELKDKRICSIMKKLDINNNENVRILKLYVDKDIKNYIERSSIDEIIIYHPDPWPKTRHRKHRLFQPDFLDAIHYLLKPNGWVKISTDDVNYVQWIVNLFNTRTDFVSKYDGMFTMIIPDNHLITYFDMLKSTEGFDPYFMMYKAI